MVRVILMQIFFIEQRTPSIRLQWEHCAAIQPELRSSGRNVGDKEEKLQFSVLCHLSRTLLLPGFSFISFLLAFQHIWISEISLHVNIALIFFSSISLRKFLQVLICSSNLCLLLLLLSCKWFAWWFLLLCFYRASSSNNPAFTLFCPRFCLPSLSALVLMF